MVIAIIIMMMIIVTATGASSTRMITDERPSVRRPPEALRAAG